jgi:hypothetical protein
MDWSKKVLRNRRALLVRVLWRNSQIEEETWEREYEIKEKYPHLFFETCMSHQF